MSRRNPKTIQNELQPQSVFTLSNTRKAIGIAYLYLSFIDIVLYTNKKINSKYYQ